jgi:hypothetical protein
MSFTVAHQMTADQPCSIFNSLLHSVQSESNVLKSIAHLRNLSPSDNLSKIVLAMVDAVQNIERDLDELNSTIASELRVCSSMDALLEEAKLSSGRIDRLENHTMQLADEERNKCNLPKGQLSADELERVPKPTRNRLTLTQLNHSLTELNELFECKKKVL